MMTQFVVKIVLVDGIAPLGARTSAGKVMTNFIVKHNTSKQTGNIKMGSDLLSQLV